MRLIVPLAVLEELDRQKFEGGDAMRKRARNAISSIHALRGDVGPDTPAIVKGPGDVPVMLDIPRDDVGRQRLAGTDDELIAFGAFLKQAGKRVMLVTRDMNLQIRAQRAGLHVLWLPEKYSKDQPEASAKG